MSTAYIFGAGASYACSSQTPLITRFFSTAKTVGGLCEKLSRDLTASLNKTLAIAEPDLLNGSVNLETVFSLVAMDGEIRSSLKQEPIEGAAQFDAGLLEHRLETFVYELLMTKTQRELNENGDLYDKLLKKTAKTDVFMTFNYDLQLDRALERIYGWSPETGYGSSFKKVLMRDESWHIPSNKKTEAPTLLKLHGSLNWLTSNGYIHRPPRTLDYDKKYIGQHYLAETLYRFPGQPEFGMAVSVPDNGVDVILQLNIVPPTLRKRLFGESENEPLRDIWRLAHQSLSEAERIIVIGYSLPPTDFHAEWLIRASVQKNKHDRIDVIVVNPDERGATRVAGMFGKKLGALEHCRSFEEFLAA